MEIPLSPLEFAQRTRRLYPEREAVVDGELRLNYEEFFARCDRWSAALQALGVQQGDRVAYIAPNTHAQLESFYAVPQIGAVLVPLNYRLIADDFAYLINHSGARIVCVHSDYLDTVESIRAQLPGVSAFVALEGTQSGWLDYETLVAEAPSHFHRPDHSRNRPAHDQLHQRHHFAAEGSDDHASQRLPQRRWHAPPPSDDRSGSLPVDAANVSR